jgi:cytochrome c
MRALPTALIAALFLSACGDRPAPIKMSESAGTRRSPPPSAAPSAPPSPKAPPDLNSGQFKYAGICLGCHGQDGRGQPPFPKLAGKPAAELAAKLNDYRAGKTLGPQSATMAPFAKALTDAEIHAIVEYLAGL